MNLAHDLYTEAGDHSVVVKLASNIITTERKTWKTEALQKFVTKHHSIESGSNIEFVLDERISHNVVMGLRNSD